MLLFSKVSFMILNEARVNLGQSETRTEEGDCLKDIITLLMFLTGATASRVENISFCCIKEIQHVLEFI